MDEKKKSLLIHFLTEFILIGIGIDKLFYVENPFDWMELISVQGKTNFFEKRVGEYANIAKSDTKDNVFSTEADF